MSWKSPSPGRAEKGRKSWIKHHRLFLVEIDTIDSPLSPYWACHLCDAKGQPEFFAAAATSSAADHLRKYVNVSVTSRARASLTDAGSTGLLRAVKQLVQIRQPTDPGWRSIPFPSTQPLVEWMDVHLGPPWMGWMEMDAKSGPVEWMDVEMEMRGRYKVPGTFTSSRSFSVLLI